MMKKNMDTARRLDAEGSAKRAERKENFKYNPKHLAERAGIFNTMMNKIPGLSNFSTKPTETFNPDGSVNKSTDKASKDNKDNKVSPGIKKLSSLFTSSKMAKTVNPAVSAQPTEIPQPKVSKKHGIGKILPALLGGLGLAGLVGRKSKLKSRFEKDQGFTPRAETLNSPTSWSNPGRRDQVVISGKQSDKPSDGSTSSFGTKMNKATETAGIGTKSTKPKTETDVLVEVNKKFHRKLKAAGVNDRTLGNQDTLNQLAYTLSPFGNLISLNPETKNGHKINHWMDTISRSLKAAAKGLLSYGGGGDSADDSSSSDDSTAEATGSGNTEKAWNFLKQSGFSDAGAAGILGNAMRESHINPSQHQIGNGPGYGLFQWGGPRKTRLQEYAKSKGKSSDDLQTQLEFAMKEINEGGYKNKIATASSAKQAAIDFQKEFERASDPNIQQRIDYANDILKQMKGKSGDNSADKDSGASSGEGGQGSPTPDDSSSKDSAKENMIKWGEKKKGKVTYSMTARTGPNSYDCSSFVYYCMKDGGKFPVPGYPWSTMTMEADADGPKKYVSWIKKGDVQRGDIFLMGAKGANGGAAGHTGIFLDEGNTILHCSGGRGVKETPFSIYAGAPMRYLRITGTSGGGSGSGSDISDEDLEEKTSKAFAHMTDDQEKALIDDIQSKYKARYEAEGEYNEKRIDELTKEKDAAQKQASLTNRPGSSLSGANGIGNSSGWGSSSSATPSYQQPGSADVAMNGVINGNIKIIGTDSNGNLIVMYPDGTFGTITDKDDLDKLLGVDGIDGVDGTDAEPGIELPLDKLNALKDILNMDGKIEDVLNAILKQVIRIKKSKTADGGKIKLLNAILDQIQRNNTLNSKQIGLLNQIYSIIPTTVSNTTTVNFNF